MPLSSEKPKPSSRIKIVLLILSVPLSCILIFLATDLASRRMLDGASKILFSIAVVLAVSILAIHGSNSTDRLKN